MRERSGAGEPVEVAVRSASKELEGIHGCRVGLCITGLEGPLAGVGFGFREYEAFPSASLIKVLVLVELLRQADTGLVSLEDGLLVEDEGLVGTPRCSRR